MLPLSDCIRNKRPCQSEALDRAKADILNFRPWLAAARSPVGRASRARAAGVSGAATTRRPPRSPRDADPTHSRSPSRSRAEAGPRACSTELPLPLGDNHPQPDLRVAGEHREAADDRVEGQEGEHVPRPAQEEVRVGDVDGRVCILVDDMIDTAGTICSAAEQLSERGASQIVAAATHGVFSGPASERLSASPIEKIIVTDTLPLPENMQTDKVEVLSVAPLIAEAIRAVFEDTSVSEIFGGNNLV